MTNVVQIQVDPRLELERKVEALRTIDRELKALTKEHSLLKAQIIEEMGDSEEVLNYKGEVIAECKIQIRKAYTVAECIFKMFKLK